MTSLGHEDDPVIAISPYGIRGASTRVRIYDWFDHTNLRHEHFDYISTSNNRPGTLLRRLPDVMGAEVELRRIRRRVAGRTVLLSRRASPFTSGGLESSILSNAAHSVYDFDDALYADESGISWLWSTPRAWKRSVEAADTVIAGSEILADAASRFSRSVVMIPSCIEPDEYIVKSVHELGAVPRAVWIGSPATEQFLHGLTEPLLALHASHGLRLTVISAGDADLGALSAMVDRVPWSLESFAVDLAQGDFGIMPLPDTPYTRGKCSYKLLQYAGAGLPLVGSPVGANEGVLKMLGGLAADTTDEWVSAVRSILDASAAERSAMGARMRSGVIAGFSYGRWKSEWLRALGADQES